MNFITKKITPFISLLFIISFAINANAEPTESRGWKTKSGHETNAVALKVEDGKAHFKKANGSVIKVNLDLLIDADIEFLTKHFDLAAEGKKQPSSTNEKITGSNTEALTGLSQPQGKVVGPIEANGSNYFLYLPKSLKKDRPAPLLFYTNSGGGGNGGLIRNLSDGAETLGWIMAISVESKNGNPESGKHVANSMKHILENWPVDKDRIHYSGNSGGAARAFINSSEIRAYGVMPNVGYIPQGINPKTEVVYGLGGGSDYNRYLTAYAAKKKRKNGFHRMTPGGHGGTTTSYYIDGMIWMHCKFMGENKSKHKDEATDFEASIISWINKIKTKDSQRAYSTACIVRDAYGISGENAKAFTGIISELSKDKNNVLYHEGLQDINALSSKYFAPLGENGGSKMKHTDPKSRRAAEKLKDKYSGVKKILDVLDAIMKPTV